MSADQQAQSGNDAWRTAMPMVVVCPECKKERWIGYGPCGSCGAYIDIPEPIIERVDPAHPGRVHPPA